MNRLLRDRLFYAGATLVVLIAGLASRVWADRLPAFVASHFGDALWAAMIYCGIRVLTANKTTTIAFAASLLFCAAIEFSQLYKAEWIEAWRGTLPGSLILGHGFLAVDLIRYAAGILIVYTVDRIVCARR
ncbi:ribosomal maturation YjgA family protein [Paenibacillus soyae]|uniref:DUF2809 domain-containing protein n=1 Tax=Paenibacillus soyae TaxID=2969249 RepID=A0A9X2SBR7_9BACL|nr:DUF2809 domain-containing protein [Paenibacillus soyae]MCR2805928.1 DUF2809 domain-containing protein [Paenibacillus soyae]